MQFQWSSKKGEERTHNNDYVSIVTKPGLIFVILVDSDRGDEQCSLSKHWADSMAEFVYFSKSIPAESEILAFIERSQKQLRNMFLLPIASYALVLIDTNNSDSIIMHCGDCKVGEIEDDSPPMWLNTTHSLSNTRFGNAANRNVLTKCLSARKYHEPEILRFTSWATKKWILCSDGYWGEHLEESVPWNKLNDDASCLTVTPSSAAFKFEADNNNFKIYQ